VTALTYGELVEQLFPRLAGGIRWGLDRTERMLAAVGDPHRKYRVVHVGGTNGKGSVAAHIDSVLRADGRRVGLYTSPHLCSFRERIRIGGVPITESALLAAAGRLWPHIQVEQASFFEATTAIAFLALADAGVDTAIVEVGLGGRLDSTNVVAPDVVVLTNVSLDHVQLLGPGIEDVAREKAGIIKRGVPLVTAECAGPAGDVIRATATRMDAPIRCMRADAIEDVKVAPDGTSFVLPATGWGELTLRTPLAGAHQATNAALAVHALDSCRPLRPGRNALVSGIAGTRWPGRLQLEKVAGVDWVFDVAHNVAGMEALVAAVRALGLPRPLCTVVGVLGDKDWGGMLTPLYAVSDHVLLTSPPSAPHDRRWDPGRVLRAAPSERAGIATDFGAALDQAYRLALSHGGAVLVTGSFHTVGDALASLRLCTSDEPIAPAAFIH
jgi:dihydrofolate synthase / folylpolyglutamate synthase